MLIPSIDLRGGRVVQLVQGRRQALAFDDVSEWVERFSGFPRVQLIDIDGALRTGTNEALARSICARVPCRVGGGVRDVACARQWLDAGATEVIVGSSLYAAGGVNERFAAELADAVGLDRTIGAGDSAGGHVVVRGCQDRVRVTTEDAAWTPKA
ncbi:MAG: HisA/HisF-related TIM barrel protein [Acidobacteria bacterium]|nr:HisA/HisF-related TIM barrel protein [Acidobacteriota bacterium]